MALLSDVLPWELSEQVANLNSHSIHKCEHFLECSETDALELGNLTHEQWLQALQLVATATCPPARTMAQLLQSREQQQLFRSGCPSLDAALGGGLALGSITEIVGPSGAFLMLCTATLLVSTSC